MTNLGFLQPQLPKNTLIPLDVVLLHALILTKTTLLQAYTHEVSTIRRKI